MKTICLISSANVASNPRLVKEANALVEAGYQVQVIAAKDMASIAASLDPSIFAQARWACTLVSKGKKTSFLFRRVQQKLARFIANSLINVPIAAWAFSFFSNALYQQAKKIPADLYIAHNLAALPAAFWAAQYHQSAFAFDAEDYHPGELEDLPKNRFERKIRFYLEKHLLPKARYVTAASPLIAKRYQAHYGIKVEAILNVFPLTEAPADPPIRPKTPSLYWFSQTVGPKRGLEYIVQAMNVMQTPIDLYLRGSISQEYKTVLLNLANEAIKLRIHFFPQAEPSELARLASNYHLGLSTEPGRDENNKICLGNKIFTYLLAGIPMLLSKTPAQEQIFQELQEAALLVDINNTTAVASVLDDFFNDPNKIKNMQQKAWELGQNVYNWDIEKEKFLTLIYKSIFN